MKLLFSLLCFVLILPACKKYDEGPDLTFRTPQRRLTNTWKYTKHTKSEKLDSAFVSFEEEFAKDGTFKRFQSATVLPGKWVFSGDKNKIEVTLDKSPTLIEVYHLVELSNSNIHFWKEQYQGATPFVHHYWGDGQD